MFTTKCFIRKNTPKLRDKLEKLGYHICNCCKFKDNVWLNNSLIKNEPSIHGIGVWDIEGSQEEALNLYISDNAKIPNPAIDCGENEELFLALAALRDDTNNHQWFIAQNTMWDENYNGEITVYYEEGDWLLWNEYSFMEDMPSDFRKATVEELIEHFK